MEQLAHVGLNDPESNSAGQVELGVELGLDLRKETCFADTGG